MNIDIQNSNVLISTLDWGLGHATRCIPLIKELIKNNCKITVAVSDKQIFFFQSELPNVAFENINAYNIKYSKIFPFWLSIILQLPKIAFAIRKEKYLLKRIIEKQAFDVIISDNRFGFRNKNIKSIFITHQLQIILPRSVRFFSKIINILNKSIIEKFDECWVPDELENGLSFEMGHSNIPKIKIIYIGTLSRFEEKQTPQKEETTKFDIIALISGPEPLKSQWEKIIINELNNIPYSVLILRGEPYSNTEIKRINNITIHKHIETKELSQHLKSAKLVISRSGYSSLMDYKQLNIKAMIIATKGQSEQEFLAKKCKENQLHYVLKEDEFCKNAILNILDNKIQLNK